MARYRVSAIPAAAPVDEPESLQFPGCLPVRISREAIADYEGRIEYWDATTGVAMVCEPVSVYHEHPPQRLAGLLKTISDVRGSPIRDLRRVRPPGARRAQRASAHHAGRSDGVPAPTRHATVGTGNRGGQRRATRRGAGVDYIAGRCGTGFGRVSERDRLLLVAVGSETVQWACGHQPGPGCSRRSPTCAARRFETFGASDLLVRDAHSAHLRIMQADQTVYLRPRATRPWGPAIEVGSDVLPDVVLEWTTSPGDVVQGFGRVSERDRLLLVAVGSETVQWACGHQPGAADREVSAPPARLPDRAQVPRA